MGHNSVRKLTERTLFWLLRVHLNTKLHSKHKNSAEAYAAPAGILIICNELKYLTNTFESMFVVEVYARFNKYHIATEIEPNARFAAKSD